MLTYALLAVKTTPINVVAGVTVGLLALSAVVYAIQAGMLKRQSDEFANQTKELTTQTEVLIKQTDEATKQTQELTAQTKLLIEQTDQAAATNRALLSQNVNRMMNGLSMLFFDHPELRCYFYDDVDPPDDEPRRTQVVVTAEMFVDFMSMALNNEILAPPDERRAWREYFHTMVQTSPAIRNYWAERHEWYENAIKSLFADALADMDVRQSDGKIGLASSSLAEGSPQ